VCVELSCGGTSPVDAVSARGFGETAACVVFVEASAFSSRAIEANASGLSSCSRSSRLSGLRLCRVLFVIFELSMDFRGTAKTRVLPSLLESGPDHPSEPTIESVA